VFGRRDADIPSFFSLMDRCRQLKEDAVVRLRSEKQALGGFSSLFFFFSLLLRVCATPSFPPWPRETVWGVSFFFSFLFLWADGTASPPRTFSFYEGQASSPFFGRNSLFFVHAFLFGGNDTEKIWT